MLNEIIHPVRLSDVIIRLDRPENIIDMTIRFQEKRRSHQSISSAMARDFRNQ